MSRRGWLLFTALSVLWGIPYLLIRVAVRDLSPAMVVCTRTGLAALLLLPLAAARGALRPLWPHRHWIVVFAAVEIAMPFGMLAVAERRLTSSLTALLIATIPIVALLLARLLGLEPHIRPTRWAGLGVGMAGVAALAGLDLGQGDLPAVGAVAATALGYALGPILVATRLEGVPGLGVSAVALTLAGAGYAPFAWLTRPPRPGAVPATAWLAVVLLGVLCSAVAFVAFFALVAEVGPARTTVITYVNPLVAVAAGVVVLGEPVTAGLLVGFPLVVAGSWLATRGRRPAAPDGVGQIT